MRSAAQSGVENPVVRGQFWSSSTGRKPVDARLPVGIARPNDHRGKAWFIDGIREMLGFETKSAETLIPRAVAAVDAVKMIGGIKLDAGLGSPCFQDPARAGFR